jgi:hypothetical protein
VDALRALRIERRWWARGDRKTALLVPGTGEMCCLGFLGLACGIHPQELYGEGEPSEVRTEAWPRWLARTEYEHDECGNEDCTGEDDAGCQATLVVRETDLCVQAIKINDDPDLGDAERERQLTALFATAGVAVEFVD